MRNFRSSLIAALFAIALLAAPALSQNVMTPISAASVNDGLTPINGTLCFVAVDVYHNPIDITRHGGGFYAKGRPICGALAAGALTSALSVPDSGTDSAPGHLYQVIIHENSPSFTDVFYTSGISGSSSWSLDNYVPASTVPTTAAFTFTHGSGAPTGACVEPAFYVNDTSGATSTCIGTAWQTYIGDGAQIGGDLGGSLTTPKVVGLQGFPLSATAPTLNQAIVWDGSQYEPQTQSSDSLDSSGSIASLPVQAYINTAHPPLAIWDAALHNCTNEVVRVQIHGDSRSIVDTTVAPGATPSLAVTYPNRWANQLKKQLQGMCGSHGTGILPLRWGTGSFTSQGMNLDYFTATGSFAATDTALGPRQSTDPMVVTATANGSSIALNTASVTDKFDHLVCYAVAGPGLNAWTMTVDGATVGTCGGTSGTETAVAVSSSGFTLGTHSASITCATEPCEAYAIEGVAGTTGVSVDNLSVGGASEEVFAQYPSTQFAFSDLAASGFALDIIYQVTNEPGQDISTTQFQTSLDNHIAHDEALASTPSVLIFSPMLDNDNSSEQAPFYPILLSTAKTYNTAYADLRGRWGTAIAPSWLFGQDYIHENNNGNGEVYSIIAQTLIDVPTPAVTAAQSLTVTTTSCPAGDFQNGMTFTGGTLAPTCTPAIVGPCGTGYAHYAALTVASSSVSGGADLTSYPALVSFNGATANSITLANLANSGSGGQVASSSGTDITFCSAASNGTTLAFELVPGTYAPSTGSAEFYVKIPDLSATASTPIYVFWDDASATSSANASAVWSNGYAAVYHFGSSSTLSLADSSGNGNTLTNTGGTASSGSFGGGVTAASASDYLLNSAPVGLATGSSPRTIEAWVKFPGTVPSNAILLGYGTYATGQESALQYSAGDLDLWTEDAQLQFPFTPGNTFHSYAVVLPSGQTTDGGVKLYADGSALTGACSGSCTTALNTGASYISINGTPASGPILGANEIVDEMRISTVGRTAGWEATQYANQSNPATFFSLGTIN